MKNDDQLSGQHSSKHWTGKQQLNQKQISGLAFHLSFVYNVSRVDLPKVCKYKNSRNTHRFKVIPFKFKEWFEQVIHIQIQELEEYPEIQSNTKEI